eukprot:2727034-Rhodomonas_salina.1
MEQSRIGPGRWKRSQRSWRLNARKKGQAKERAEETRTSLDSIALESSGSGGGSRGSQLR